MEKLVRVTKKELERRFIEYNALYFENELPMPQSFNLWTCNSKCVGWVRAVWNRRKQDFNTHFHINARLYKWTDENLRSVMVHEMIHIAIEDYMRPVRWWHWLIPPKQHDRMFVDLMNELNERYGLHIATRAKQMRAYRR